MTRNNASLSLIPVAVAGCGIATFSIMDALMKSAALLSGVYAALLWRSIFGAGIGLAAWGLHGFRDLRHRRWPGRGRLLVHAARASVACGMAYLFFWGLVRTPMAVGMALSFIAPIIALYLAALILGEPVTRRALTASLLGLAGVVVIGAGQLADGAVHTSLWGMAAILGSAVLYAGNLVLQRHQAQLASPGEITFFQGLFVAVLLAPAAAWLPALPATGAWGQVIFAAVLGSASLMLLAWAWGRAEAHRLLPMEYSAFIWSALVGWLWFHEALQWATVAGVALIVVGCWIGTMGGGGEGRDDHGADHIEQTAL